MVIVTAVGDPAYGTVLPTGVGRTHGTSQRTSFDRWFRYPAGFASDYIPRLLDGVDWMPGNTIVDPFAGSGVTGTAVRGLGMQFVGIEAHPLIADLAVRKLRFPAGVWATSRPSSGMVRTARWIGLSISTEQLLERARRRSKRISDAYLDREHELVRRCFDRDVLRDLVAIRHEVTVAQGADKWAPWIRWALLATLREAATANVGWPYQRPSVQRQAKVRHIWRRVADRVFAMEEDIWSVVQAKSEQQGASQLRVLVGDSRMRSSWRRITDGSVGGCLSSPPYLNNFDYADATRLELYFLGLCRSWAELCDWARRDMLVATTQQAKVAAAESAARELSRLAAADEIRTLTSVLEEERLSRPRGKEYDRVLPIYFRDMARVLANMARATRQDSVCLWVIGDSAPYGVYVDTPRIVGLIAEELGYEVSEDRPLRQRGLRWNISTRHGVGLSERLLVFRRTRSLPGTLTSLK